jgi:nucleoside-diphosphate-sugar epimerase
MIKGLIIGDTSQLSYYFPEDYQRISSYNIDFSKFKDKSYDRIFLCAGEQRTFIEGVDNEKMFIEANVDYAFKLIDFFKDKCDKIIVYATSELWNNCDGPIDLSVPFNYNYSPYIRSKELLTNKISLENYPNIIVLYPFNFNSIYRAYQYMNGKFYIRSEYKFLFSKIFESIITETSIEIGDTYFYRDLIHPKYVVERSILAEKDEIVGSGRLTFVNDFIRDLYKRNDLNYNKLVTENYDHNLILKRKIYHLNSRTIKYNNLLEDTLNDIQFIRHKIKQ